MDSDGVRHRLRVRTAQLAQMCEQAAMMPDTVGDLLPDFVEVSQLIGDLWVPAWQGWLPQNFDEKDFAEYPPDDVFDLVDDVQAVQRLASRARAILVAGNPVELAGVAVELRALIPPRLAGLAEAAAELDRRIGSVVPLN